MTVELSAWHGELARIAGEAHVREVAPETDGLPATLEVEPGSAEETAAVLRFANENGLNLVPAGGMTKQGFGHAMERVDILLRTHRLDQILYYDPGDLTFGIGAGATVRQVQRTLSPNRQMLPLESLLPAKATVGGVLATNSHGPLKHFYGGPRDYCIGIEFATPAGKVVKGGGRVVKNVAGFDLMKLMIGSHGTLGVITSANFKVFPAPTQTRTFVATFSELSDAVAFRDRVARSVLTPLALEIASPQAQEYFVEALVARNPDAHMPAAPLKPGREWRVYVRVAGSDRVLARYRAGLQTDEELTVEEEARLWQGVVDFEANVMARHHNAMIVHLYCTMASVQSAIAAAEKAALDNSCIAAVVGRAAAGALVVAVIPLAVGPPSAMHYANVASALRSALPGRDASAIVARCPLEAKSRFDVWGTSPTDAELMSKVRGALDPKGTLSPGRFVV